MALNLSRLSLVRRYLWGSLLAAILPLLTLAVLYDRYSANLLDTLVSQRIDSDMKATVLRMNSFLGTQFKRLEALADLPEIGQVLQTSAQEPLPEGLLDFLYFETGSPDIYGILFFDLEGRLVRAVPTQDIQNFEDSARRLPATPLKDLMLIGPQLPEHGMPGWFLLEKTLYISQRKVGSVALKVRLASLSEQSAALYRRGVFTPVILAATGVGVTAVGTRSRIQSPPIQSLDILPGWKLALVDDGLALQEPRNWIRYVLLGLVVFVAIVLWTLYLHMSRRLTLLLAPLINGARSISDGDFSARVPTRAPSELAELAHSFNEMSSQLQSLIESRVDSERRASLGSIAAGMAHEIRNPLATVKTSVHALRTAEVNQERGELLEAVLDEIERIDTIFEEFLGYARPREPCREVVRVKEVFKSVKTLIGTSAAKANVRISMAGESQLVLHVDPLQFRQILMNLVLNALQAMPDGGHITLRGHRDGLFGVIVISDTGIGIGSEHLNRIMMPFYTTKSQGTGLGLAIGAQLVRTNGGHMDIDSTPGLGTRVTLRLPSCQDDPS